MNRHKVTQKNFLKVMDEIKKQFTDVPETRSVWVEELERMLNNLLAEDFFGTEGQCDPRGDQRD